MAVSAVAAARLVCEIRDWQVSNLMLQKILYVAQMVHLGRHGMPLLFESFEAWDYGPVLPEIYRQLSMFGSLPVKDVFKQARPLPATDERKTLGEVVPFLARFTPGELVGLTHCPGGAWATFYRPKTRGIVIPNQAIATEFRARQQVAQAHSFHLQKVEAK
jgi:uncharacterized phage-associated protein